MRSCGFLRKMGWRCEAGRTDLRGRQNELLERDSPDWRAEDEHSRMRGSLVRPNGCWRLVRNGGAGDGCRGWQERPRSTLGRRRRNSSFSPLRSQSCVDDSTTPLRPELLVRSRRARTERNHERDASATTSTQRCNPSLIAKTPSYCLLRRPRLRVPLDTIGLQLGVPNLSQTEK